MRRFLIAIPILILAALPAAATAAGVRHVVTDSDTKPADPGFVPMRTPWDCSSRQTFAPVVGWSLTVDDNTAGGPSNLPGYSCLPAWNEDGPEHIYRLEVAQELEFWAGLSNLGADLDLFLLAGCDGAGCQPGACDTDNCLVSANMEFTALLAPGTYFLVVDTWGSGSPSGGAYTLRMDGRWRGVPSGNCSAADPVALACSAVDTTGADLFGQPDLLRTYDACGDTVEVTYIKRSGEVWYAIDAPGQHMVSLTAVPDTTTLDLALALFTGCGPGATCLAFVDEELAGLPEILAWPQEAAAAETVWLAVDAVRPPLEGEGGFQLIFDCGTVPAEATSFGDFRARFR
jgi:hypothetical protein